MLKREAENLTQKMVVFEVNDQGVPIREIYRAVEKRLGLEALGGSVNKMRKSVFCFSKFESTLIEKAKLETVLTRY